MKTKMTRFAWAGKCEGFGASGPVGSTESLVPPRKGDTPLDGAAPHDASAINPANAKPPNPAADVRNIARRVRTVENRLQAWFMVSPASSVNRCR